MTDEGRANGVAAPSSQHANCRHTAIDSTRFARSNRRNPVHKYFEQPAAPKGKIMTDLDEIIEAHDGVATN